MPKYTCTIYRDAKQMTTIVVEAGDEREAVEVGQQTADRENLWATLDSTITDDVTIEIEGGDPPC